ncbi:MAG TPA: phage portal protein [Candidatus Heimdallarchaeota archaeon]|nr:phage portal protein [Candidatus Heimdallarchaeota archaeon]
MTIFQRISAAIKALRGTAREDWMAYYGTGPQPTLSGVNIDESTALTISALYAALNFLAGVVASLPLRVYRSLPGGGKERAIDHPLYDRLHAKPNGTGMTAWQWVYTSVMHKYLWGNWWTVVRRPSYELTPLMADRTWIDYRSPTIVRTKDNAGAEFLFDRRDVLLVPHVSLGGITGKGVVAYARESLGLIKAQEQFASAFFGSGTKAGGFVQIPGGMDEDTRHGLQADFNEKYGKLGESWKAIFLSGGAEWKPQDIDAVKAQALESRLFSVAEVSRWTGLAPHLLHDLSRATFSNIEELDLALVMFTLTPIVTQIEQAMNLTFFSDAERQQYYVKFELKGLLRGNIAARTAFYTAMIDRGVFHANNVLELEDMDLQEDGLGEIYIVSLNTANKRKFLEPTVPVIEDVPDEEGEADIADEVDEEEGEEAPRSMVISAPGRVILQRSSALRRKITLAYGKQWEAYTAQVIKEETEQLRAGIKEWLHERSAGEFVTWLDNFYVGFQSRVADLSAPLLSSYAAAILPIAQQEINSDADIAPRYEQFGQQYREAFVLRHVGQSRGQLRAAALEAEDAEIEIEQLLTDWEGARPGKIVQHESVRAENAFARSVFALAGVVKIRSVAYGKSCPYCSALDGRVIGIEEAFLTEGDFQPEGADRPLTVTSTYNHPPYHGGCDCGIEASI